MKMLKQSILSLACLALVNATPAWASEDFHERHEERQAEREAEGGSRHWYPGRNIHERHERHEARRGRGYHHHKYHGTPERRGRWHERHERRHEEGRSHWYPGRNIHERHEEEREESMMMDDGKEMYEEVDARESRVHAHKGRHKTGAREHHGHKSYAGKRIHAHRERMKEGKRKSHYRKHYRHHGHERTHHHMSK